MKSVILSLPSRKCHNVEVESVGQKMKIRLDHKRSPSVLFVRFRCAQRPGTSRLLLCRTSGKATIYLFRISRGMKPDVGIKPELTATARVPGIS